MKRPSRLLVVDDNEDLVDNLSDIFTPRGFDVHVARSAQEGLFLARSDGFDLAFVDVNLPDSSGLEMLPALRDASPSGEIILITGHATIDAAVAAVRGGAFHFVVKPFKPNDLIAAAENALRQVALRRDRDELKRRAAEAEALAHMGTLAAGLAHEIRNPLNAAVLQLHLLGRQIDRLPEGERPQLRGRVDIVSAELKRLEHLVSDFLEFAQPRPLAREPVNMHALLSEVVAFHEPLAAARGIELKSLLGETHAAGDRERLKQVFHNLVTNAIEATPHGGEITIETSPLSGEGETERAVVVVRDTGKGIPAPLVDRIFEPFFTTKEAGTGLGLTIVRQMIERHGGSVRIESDEGHGTQVRVELPTRLRSAG